jgi:hypothetical protein
MSQIGHIYVFEHFINVPSTSWVCHCTQLEPKSFPISWWLLNSSHSQNTTIFQSASLKADSNGLCLTICEWLELILGTPQQLRNIRMVVIYFPLYRVLFFRWGALTLVRATLRDGHDQQQQSCGHKGPYSCYCLVFSCLWYTQRHPIPLRENMWATTWDLGAGALLLGGHPSEQGEVHASTSPQP